MTTATRTATEAVSYMSTLHARGTRTEVGHCLQVCRTAWGLAARSPSASAEWASIAARHRHTGPAPLGAPLFWTGGSHGYGHVALSDGAGSVWSTDLPVPGRVGRVPVTEVARAWPGHLLVGWSDTLEGAALPLGRRSG